MVRRWTRPCACPLKSAPAWNAKTRTRLGAYVLTVRTGKSGRSVGSFLPCFNSEGYFLARALITRRSVQFSFDWERQYQDILRQLK